MERKTKKMVTTQAEIDQKSAEIQSLNDRISVLNNYKPTSKNGQDAKEQAVNELVSHRDVLSADITKLAVQLEVLTVDMLAGKDIDFAEPTPADALKNAS